MSYKELLICLKRLIVLLLTRNYNYPERIRVGQYHRMIPIGHHAQGRKLASLIFTVVLLRLYPVVTTPVVKWFGYWTTHRSMILTLTVVNTAITSASELSSRSIVSALKGSLEGKFVVKSPDGKKRVHRQSMRG